MTGRTGVAVAIDGVEAADVLASIDRWVAQPGLSQLVEAFGGRLPTGSSAARLAFLDEFSARHWDFRNGLERNMAKARTFDAETTAVVMGVARDLGMIGTDDPISSRYTHVLVLGGLVRACILRPARAAALVRQGLSAESVTAITAFRALQGDEPGLAAAVGLMDVHNEYEAMRTGMARAFDLAEEDLLIEVANANQDHRMAFSGRWELPHLEVGLVVAPSGSVDPNVRANTADTYAYWAPRVGLTAADRVLVITSTIYANQQHCDALRVLGLGYGCTVETIGVDGSADTGPLRQTFEPYQYLQEVRSAVRAAEALRRAALSVSDT